MSKTYLTSTTPGKTWSLGFSKQPKKPAYWYAIEGELERTEYEGVGFTTFKFALFQSKSVRQLVDGTATAKKKAAAYEALVAKLKAEGLVEAA